MKMRERAQTGLAITFFLLAVCAVLAQNQPAPAPDVAVIVNPANPVDTISLTDLRRIYSGEKLNWSAGLPVFLMVRAPQAHERSVLLNLVLRMNESEYKQFWVRKIYSGEVQREPLA